MDSPIVVKKNPVVIIRNFIFLELLALSVFFVVAVSADYGEMYKGWNFSSVIPYELAETALIALFEICLIVFIFLQWTYDSYEINSGKIVHKRGVFFREKTIFQLHFPIVAICHQNFFSRRANYGTVMIYNQASKDPIVLDHISTPEMYVELLMAPEAKKREYAEFNQVPDARRLVRNGEHDKLEFKTSLRWDARGHKVNKAVERSVLKTIAAFMNSGGGHLVIGVDDKGNPLGLENDYSSLNKPNADGFENHFTNLFNAAIGAEFRRFVRCTFYNIEDKEICVVEALASPKPAYVRFDENEDFYIRTGNSTTALRLSETASYINAWWPRFG